jgi:hypothetical protein
MLTLRNGCLVAAGIAVLLGSCGGAVIGLAAYGHSIEQKRRDRALAPVRAMLSEFEAKVEEIGQPGPGMRRHLELSNRWNEMGGISRTSPRNAAALAELKTLLADFPDALQKWERESMRFPSRLWVAAGEVGLTGELRHEVGLGPMSLSEDVVRGFEARWAQLDAIQRTMRTLEADRWQFKDGAIKFDDPAVQQQFAELLDELDWHAKRVELSVQSMRSKRRSRSSP